VQGAYRFAPQEQALETPRRPGRLPHALLAAVVAHAAVLIVARHSPGASLDVDESIDRSFSTHCPWVSAASNPRTLGERSVVEPFASERLIGEAVDGIGRADAKEPWPSAGLGSRAGGPEPNFERWHPSSWFEIHFSPWVSEWRPLADQYDGRPMEAHADKSVFLRTTFRHGDSSGIEPEARGYARLRGHADRSLVGRLHSEFDLSGHAIAAVQGTGRGLPLGVGSGFDPSSDTELGSTLVAPLFSATLTLRWMAGEVAIEGPFSPEALQRSVVAKVQSMSSCLARAPDLEGRLRIRLTIDGTHVRAVAAHPTAVPAGVEACVLGRLGAIEVPR
jgi:hypothetical protein